MQVGDILVYKSYYRIIVPDFYKVVALSASGKTGRVVRLENVLCDSYDPPYNHRGTYVPGAPQSTIESFKMKVLSPTVAKIYDEFGSYNGAKRAAIWDGKPAEFDWDD